MNFKNIVLGMKPIFDEEQSWIFAPTAKNLKEKYFVTRAMDLNGSRSYATKIEDINVLFIDTKKETNKNLADNMTHDIILLNGNITLVIFIDRIVNESNTLIQIYDYIYDIMRRIVDILLPNDHIKTTYHGIRMVSSLVMTIKTLQANVVNFNKTDIEKNINTYFDKIGADEDYKKTYNEMIDLIFSEYIDDLLDNGGIYEYTTKLFS